MTFYENIRAPRKVLRVETSRFPCVAAVLPLCCGYQRALCTFASLGGHSKLHIMYASVV